MRTFFCLILLAVSLASPLHSESQPTEYPGVADPFADPGQYEFAEEEKADKEFFHLGRFLMIGLDMGAAIFTGGLGSTTSPGFLIGGHLVYFFDRAFGLEIRGSYSDHLDNPKSGTGSQMQIDTQLGMFTGGFRYYFDTKSAPHAIAVANPYLSLGGGVYLRNQNILFTNAGGATPALGPSTNFGGYAGGGIQFLVYRNYAFLGLDIRYHLVFFPDEGSTLNGLVPPGGRAGDYVTFAVNTVYNF